MQNIILFDDKDKWPALLPIVYTRPISDIRLGILTIKGKWQKYFPDSGFSYMTADYLSAKYPAKITDDNIFIAGNYCPDKETAAKIEKLAAGEALYFKEELIAFRGSAEDFKSKNFKKESTLDAQPTALHQL